MKIVYLGNYTAPWCTEVHISKTLENLGHEVIRIQEIAEGHPGWLSYVPADTDLFLYTRTWGKMVTLEDLAELKRRGIPSASYHLDLYVGLSRQTGIESDPFWRTDFVFSADGDPESQKFFESKGINHFWLLPGVFEDECKMYERAIYEQNGVEMSPYKMYDVIFVGGGAEYGHPEWPYRHQLVKHLEERYGERYTKFGHPQKTVRGAELNQLYANTKIAVGDSVNIGFKHKNYTSDRLFESMGRGAFTIYPRIEGIAELFQEGVNAVFYEHGNLDDLDAKIDYYLEHESEREAIRRAGFEFVKSSQTYTQRLQRLLSVVTHNLPTLNQKSVTEDVSGVLEDDWEDTEDGGRTSPSLNKALNDSLELQEKDPRAYYDKFDVLKLNLGCGNDIEAGMEWANVDMIDNDGVDVIHNLINFPYPFPDNKAEYIKAVDVLEHMPPYIGEAHGVIKFIEECHRILKPGGTLFIQTPGWKAEFLWIDPTHVRGFDIQSMDFFDPTTHFGSHTGFYSQCKFKVRAEELPNHNLKFWMEAIK